VTPPQENYDGGVGGDSSVGYAAGFAIPSSGGVQNIFVCPDGWTDKTDRATLECAELQCDPQECCVKTALPMSTTPPVSSSPAIVTPIPTPTGGPKVVPEPDEKDGNVGDGAQGGGYGVAITIIIFVLVAFVTYAVVFIVRQRRRLKEADTDLVELGFGAAGAAASGSIKKKATTSKETADGGMDAEAAEFAAKARRLSRSRLGAIGRRSSIARKADANLKDATDDDGNVRL
jgi:hypothetical protein